MTSVFMPTSLEVEYQSHPIKRKPSKYMDPQIHVLFPLINCNSLFLGSKCSCSRLSPPTQSIYVWYICDLVNFYGKFLSEKNQGCKKKPQLQFQSSFDEIESALGDRSSHFSTSFRWKMGCSSTVCKADTNQRN